MLIVFKSPASGDVILLGQDGKHLLSVLGKDPKDPKGILTVEQLPGAIAALKSASELDKSTRANAGGDEEGADAEHGGGVHLFQRALPLIELLERSLNDKVPVTWGV